jgi:UDP-N-acetyl-D-glucosamine dehydrogenase
VRGSRVVILGVAYKRDVNDVRESPALDVIELLRQKGADVVYHDPHVPQVRMDGGHSLYSAEFTPELLRSADCVAILTDHRWYNWEQVVAESRLIVDTRHVVANIPGTTPIVSL